MSIVNQLLVYYFIQLLDIANICDQIYALNLFDVCGFEV